MSAEKPVDVDFLLTALQFSAENHRDQRRKGAEASPYVNHPIEVSAILANIGEVRDVRLLAAAALHDTLEDTLTTPDELERHFGRTVRLLVQEVTDDKSLPKDQRKRLQIEHAPHLSRGAKLIKLADKVCNVKDVTENPPASWSLERRRAYLDWAENVVAGLRSEALIRPLTPALMMSCDVAGRLLEVRHNYPLHLPAGGRCVVEFMRGFVRRR
jgi:guanosine-3',5'-bis(diphosphate) 3'-pyrophosphohydrolase